MGKRHRRIRARSATGQVAGAATEKPGLNTPIVQTGLPNLRSPKGPSSQSAEPTSTAGQHSAFTAQLHAPSRSSEPLGSTDATAIASRHKRSRRRGGVPLALGGGAAVSP